LQKYSKKFNPKEFKMPKQFCLLTVMLTGLLLTNVSVHAESHPPAPINSELDNTERNVRDSEDTTLTPEDQQENELDRAITAAIRREIVNNESLSFNAHNIKIITRDGRVTLRGPVENAAEKIKLQVIAEKLKGVKHIDNQLENKAP